jgi:hypothetical protein
MKVSVHELINNVDIVECIATNGLHNILHCDDVLMEKMA